MPQTKYLPSNSGHMVLEKRYSVGIAEQVEFFTRKHVFHFVQSESEHEVQTSETMKHLAFYLT